MSGFITSLILLYVFFFNKLTNIVQQQLFDRIVVLKRLMEFEKQLCTTTVLSTSACNSFLISLNPLPKMQLNLSQELAKLNHILDES